MKGAAFGVGLIALILSGCSVQRAVVAQDARQKMVGMPKEQVLACMGPPSNRAAEGATEVWSYASGDGTVTSFGSGSSQTQTSVSGQRFGGGFSADAQSNTTGFGTAVSRRRFCTINVVMTEGRVAQLNYSGPTGGLLTGGEQCAFALENCVR